MFFEEKKNGFHYRISNFQFEKVVFLIYSNSDFLFRICITGQLNLVSSHHFPNNNIDDSFYAFCLCKFCESPISLTMRYKKFTSLIREKNINPS
jgi:hypothetical protein